MTTEHSTYDHSYDGKPQSIHQAADVLRTLINKLPEKDSGHDIEHDTGHDVGHDTGHNSYEPYGEYSDGGLDDHIIPPFTPLKDPLPSHINGLPLQPLSHTQGLSVNYGDSSIGVQPPPGADPEAYKIYRAMSQKLAGSNPHRPSKKPYIVLENFDQRYNTREHTHAQAHQAHSHTANHFNNGFEIQKSVSFHYTQPRPSYMVHKRRSTDDVSRGNIRMKRPAST